MYLPKYLLILLFLLSCARAFPQSRDKTIIGTWIEYKEEKNGSQLVETLDGPVRIEPHWKMTFYANGQALNNEVLDLYHDSARATGRFSIKDSILTFGVHDFILKKLNDSELVFYYDEVTHYFLKENYYLNHFHDEEKYWMRYNHADSMLIKADDCLKQFKARKDYVQSADEKPEFPGGQKAFQKYIQSHLHFKSLYPTDKTKHFYRELIVEKDGSITPVECADAVGEALKNMPHWKPANIKGQPVAYYLELQFDYYY
jgi:hypothetical protein